MTFKNKDFRALKNFRFWLSITILLLLIAGVIAKNSTIFISTSGAMQQNKADALDVQKSIQNLNVRIDEIEKKTLGLREAINPKNPEEVLIIARLNDSIKEIKQDIDGIEKQYNEDFQDFKASVIRELDASNKATNYILVVLIPLVLNLIYNFWKDRKTVPQKNNGL